MGDRSPTLAYNSIFECFKRTNSFGIHGSHPYVARQLLRVALQQFQLKCSAGNTLHVYSSMELAHLSMTSSQWHRPVLHPPSHESVGACMGSPTRFLTRRRPAWCNLSQLSSILSIRWYIKCCSF